MHDYETGTPLPEQTMSQTAASAPTRPIFAGVTEGRRRNMRAVSSKDTKPEIAVRPLLPCVWIPVPAARKGLARQTRFGLPRPPENYRGPWLLLAWARLLPAWPNTPHPHGLLGAKDWRQPAARPSQHGSAVFGRMAGSGIVGMRHPAGGRSADHGTDELSWAT